MKLTKDNVLEKWAEAKLLLNDKKEFIDLAEDSFIPFANLYDEFDDDMKKDFDQFLDTANKLLDAKENEVFEKEPKYKVGDWVIVKVHMPDGSVQESFPILISEVSVMPDGRIMYTEDGGQYDFFEDQIIRKTTAPKKAEEPKRITAKEAKSIEAIKANLIESADSLTQSAERRAEKDGYGVDLEKLESDYKKSVRHNDFDDMFIILELLEACNFHKEREFFIKQDWKGLKKFIKSEEEKEKPKKEPKPKSEKPTFNTKSIDILTEAVGMDKKKLIKIIEDTPKNLKTSNEFKDLIGGLGISKVIHFVNKVTNESYYDGMKAGLRFEDLMVDFITDAKRRDEIVKDYLKKETTKPKAEKPTSTATPVEALSPEVKLIKRVITLQGKTIKKANADTKNNPRTILNALQRAILSKQIRKTSKYADEVMYAQDALIRIVNGALSGALSGSDVINFTRYDDLVKVANSEVVSETAKIASQFIKIQEKEGKQKEAENLLKRIDKSGENGEEIDGMKKALKNYVDGKTTKLKASEQVLKGLHGIVDVNFESGDVVNSTTIEGKHFDTLDFHGRWEGFFGKPNPDFKFMFYGKPGNGKSTFALQFAGYLSRELGLPVLYVANEEGFGLTLQEKVKRLGVANSNLYLCDSLPEDLSQFSVVFLDSVNNMGLEPEDLKALPSGKAYVYVFQTTKDGNYMGKQEFAHDVDTVVRVENMNAYKDKNRYGGEIQEFKVG